MTVLNGSTRIDKALDFVRENVLFADHKNNKNRDDAPDIVVLLTDGKNDPGKENV